MALAFDDFAVDRETLAGFDQHQIVQAQSVDGDILLATVDDLNRPFRTQCFQRADGAGGLAFGAALQVFAEQHQGNDHRRRFEIQMRHAPGGGGPLVKTQTVAGAGAEGDQQVHVARSGTHGFPRRYIKACTEYELHGRGEGELRPGREHPVDAERLQQHRRHQRQGQGDGADQRPALMLEALLLVIGLRVFGLPDAGRITGLAHGLKQRLRVDLAEQIQMRTFVGQVHADAFHARHFVQRTFDATDAGGAGHAFDIQFDSLLRHAVTGALNCCHQGRQTVAGRLHPGLLGGEVDADGTGTADFAQRPLDTAGAAGAGHAGNRQVESDGIGHWSYSL
ncbi:hypothetical protein D3C84_227280 [compost metagenome]